MDRFLCIEAFVRVAETNNFAEAARQLGVTSSVVTKRIQLLESFIDAPLFHRSTRHVRLSEVGESFYKDCADAIANFNALTDQMRESRASPVGRLRVQMLPGFAIHHFGPLLADFNRRYPGIQMDIVVMDRVVDPIEEGFDVAFQIFPPIAETLIERRLFSVRRLFCAAPTYLEDRGIPADPYALHQHTTALYAGYPSRNRWVFSHGDEKIEIQLPGHIRSSSVHLLRDYALTGAGIVCLPTLVASEDLLSGALIPILTDYALEPFTFSAVFPVTQRQAPKVRALVEFLSDHFSSEPSWDVPLLERGWVR